MAYNGELEVALAAVREAAALCQGVQAKLTPEQATSKQDASPVTVADYAAQALICKRLQAAFPGDPVIGEETSSALRESPELLAQVIAQVANVVPHAEAESVCGWIDRGGRREPAARAWTLDPIDGTKGFVRGAHYAVALALIVDGQVVVAALGAPNLDGGVLFHAVLGGGAWSSPLTGGEPTRVNVGASDGLPWCESFEGGSQDHELSARVALALGATEPPRRLDSMVKYGLVARGDCDLLPRLQRQARRENVWDHAAGCLVVTEAGGTVTDLSGAPLDFSQGAQLGHTGGLVVSNGARHAEVLAALSAERAR